MIFTVFGKYHVLRVKATVGRQREPVGKIDGPAEIRRGPESDASDK